MGVGVTGAAGRRLCTPPTGRRRQTIPLHAGRPVGRAPGPGPTVASVPPAAAAGASSTDLVQAPAAWNAAGAVVDAPLPPPTPAAPHVSRQTAQEWRPAGTHPAHPPLSSPHYCCSVNAHSAWPTTDPSCSHMPLTLHQSAIRRVQSTARLHRRAERTNAGLTIPWPSGRSDDPARAVRRAAGVTVQTRSATLPATATSGSLYRPLWCMRKRAVVWRGLVRTARS